MIDIENTYINVRLKLSDANKIKDLIPEISESVDNYYVFKKVYDKTMFDLCNWLRFLSSHDFREHKGKLQTVLNIIDSFFDNDLNRLNTRKAYGNQHITDLSNIVNSIYDFFWDILDSDFNKLTYENSEEFKQICTDYLNRIDIIIKD